VGVFYLFSAVFAWQLGGLTPETLASTRGTGWTFALCFAVIAVELGVPLCHTDCLLHIDCRVPDLGRLAPGHNDSVERL
jgi:hypothetical protein